MIFYVWSQIMGKVYLLSFVFLLAISTAIALNKCAPHFAGERWSVCVCNSTYCDNLEPFVKTAHGVVNQFVTSQDGDRMTKYVLHLEKSQPAHDAQTITVTVDRKTKYQKIIGFGGAFTDAAGINIAKLDKPMRERMIRDYFATDGLEYNFNRMTIGSADFSIRPYTYDDDAVDESLSTFALQFEDLLFKIPYMKLAQQVSPHKQKHFGSTWSPPAWMKDNNRINNGGRLKGEPGGKYYKLFAKYLVKFVQEYAKHKVDMWGITVENEPFYKDQHYPWGSLFLNSTMERDFVKLDLGPELAAAGFTKDKFNLIIFDDALRDIKGYIPVILDDKDAAKYVMGSAFHWYGNDRFDYTTLDHLYDRYPGHAYMSTETCIFGFNIKHSLGHANDFYAYAKDIIKAMNHRVAGYADWNLAVDYNGGPNWANLVTNAAIVVDPIKHEYYKQPFFYAMGHFSKFVSPDSFSIRHETSSNAPASVMVTSFERPDNGTVVTILNSDTHEHNFQVHDPQSGYINVKVKPESLYTLVWY